MDKISEQDEVRELSKNMELNIYNNKDNINENKYKEKKIQDLSELEEKNEQNFEYFHNCCDFFGLPPKGPFRIKNLKKNCPN